MGGRQHGSIAKLKGNDRFELLLTLCRDAIGAVSILPQEEVADV